MSKYKDFLKAVDQKNRKKQQQIIEDYSEVVFMKVLTDKIKADVDQIN